MTKRKIYDKHFKERAVKLSYDRGSVLQAAKELGISDSSLGKWRKDYEMYGDNSFPGKGNERLTDEQRRIKELEKELRDRELDLEILKKAIAFFSRTDK
ncbi:MAG: transposase [Rikenellaceae bacterium]